MTARTIRPLLEVRLSLTFALALLSVPGLCPAATITVGPAGDYATIQAAINAANGGDTIQVAAGTYVENLVWATKDLQLLGSGAGVSVVDGNATGSCLRMEVVPSTSRVEGFTFTNGDADDVGGIYCYQSSPTITNNTISGNWAYDGGGIYCYQSFPTITNNTISGNRAYDGGGIYCEQSSPTITNNTISGNWAYNGGGIECYYYSSPTITNTIISFSTNGGGIYVDGGTPTVSYCDVYGNTGGNYVGMADRTGSNGNISLYPLFADGDFHLKSVIGWWDGDSWEVSAEHSPCIDAGDPVSPYANEPSPNGGRVNIGAYGNTAQASKSAPAPTVIAITPSTGRNNESVSITDLEGTGFLAGAAVALQKLGETEIPGTSVAVVDPTQITCQFDLTGATIGLWDVTVTNPDAQSDTLADGFEVVAGDVSSPDITGWQISAVHGGTVGELCTTLADGTCECRTIAADCLVVTFDEPVDGATFGTGCVTLVGVTNGDQSALVQSVVLEGDGSTACITLSDTLPEPDRYTITLSDGICDPAGNELGGDRDVQFVCLHGDANGNGNVDIGDMLAVRARFGQAVDTTNCRYDVNGNGTIDIGDMLAVRARFGHSAPAAP